jgi:hypothetical protein
MLGPLARKFDTRAHFDEDEHYYVETEKNRGSGAAATHHLNAGEFVRPDLNGKPAFALASC